MKQAQILNQLLTFDEFTFDSNFGVNSALAEVIVNYSSLKMISIAIKIEQEFAVDITDNIKFPEIQTVADLIELIREELHHSE